MKKIVHCFEKHHGDPEHCVLCGARRFDVKASNDEGLIYGRRTHKSFLRMRSGSHIACKEPAFELGF